MGMSEWNADHVYDAKTIRRKKRSPPIPPLQDYIWDDLAASSGHGWILFSPFLFVGLTNGGGSY